MAHATCCAAILVYPPLVDCPAELHTLSAVRLLGDSAPAACPAWYIVASTNDRVCPVSDTDLLVEELRRIGLGGLALARAP